MDAGRIPILGSRNMAHRPTGVTILGIMMVLGGVGNIFSAYVDYMLPLYIQYPIGYIAYSTVMGIALLIVGVLLLTMKPWARWAATIMGIIGIVGSSAIPFWLDEILPGTLMLSLVEMIPVVIIALIMIIYLLQGSVKVAFENPDAADSW